MVLARLFFFFPFFTGVGVSKHKIGTWAFMRVGMFSEQSYVIINKPLKSLLNHASIWIFKTSAFLSSSCFFFFFFIREKMKCIWFFEIKHTTSRKCQHFREWFACFAGVTPTPMTGNQRRGGTGSRPTGALEGVDVGPEQ